MTHHHHAFQQVTATINILQGVRVHQLHQDQSELIQIYVVQKLKVVLYIKLDCPPTTILSFFSDSFSEQVLVHSNFLLLNVDFTNS